MVFLHRTLGRPLRQSGRLFSRCVGFFRQSDSYRAGAVSAQPNPNSRFSCTNTVNTTGIRRETWNTGANGGAGEASNGYTGDK